MTVASAFAKGRAQIQALMTDTCAIRPTVMATHATQGSVPSWPSVRETVACDVQGPQSSPTGEIDNSMLPHHHRVKVPAGTTIAVTDHIEWVGTGITLEVIAEPRHPGSNAMTLSVLTVEVVDG